MSTQSIRLSLFRVALGTLIAWFVFVDLVRKAFEGAVALLVVSDLLALFVFALVYRRRSYRAQLDVVTPAILKLLCIAFAALVLAQAFNPAIPSPILSLAGLRSYLLYLPAIGVGVVLLRSRHDIATLHRYLRFFGFVTIALAGYQAAVGSQNLPLLLRSMDAPVHSFGEFTFDLVPSTFASSRRFGRFLVLVYPLVYGSAVYLGTSRRYRLALAGLFFAGGVISGSREVLVLYVLFHVMFWMATTRYRLIKPVIAVSAALLAAATWFTVMDYSFYDITESNYRRLALLSTRDDWVFRVRSSLIEPWDYLRSEYSQQELFTGTGVGTYGSETTILGTSEEVQELGINRSAGGDAGMSKLIVELGAMGFAIVSAMWAVVLAHMWRCVRATRRTALHPFAIAVFFVPVSWTILVIKAHTTISDGMMSLALWLSVGILLGLKAQGAQSSIRRLSSGPCEAD